MIITGTSHFVSVAAAERYYRPYLGDPVFKGSPPERRDKKDAENRRIVARKIEEGEIHIGPPALKPGQRLSIIRDEGRYQITEGGAS